MLASELIKNIQAGIARHGDRPVVTDRWTKPLQDVAGIVEPVGRHLENHEAFHIATTPIGD